MNESLNIAFDYPPCINVCCQDNHIKSTALRLFKLNRTSERVSVHIPFIQSILFDNILTYSSSDVTHYNIS